MLRISEVQVRLLVSALRLRLTLLRVLVFVLRLFLGNCRLRCNRYTLLHRQFQVKNILNLSREVLLSLRCYLQAAFFRGGQGSDQIAVDVVLEHVAEVVRAVEADAFTEVALIEVFREELLLARKVSVEFAHIDLLKRTQGMLAHFKEETLVLHNGLKCIVDDLIRVACELLARLDLPDKVTLLQQLEQPVLLALVDLDAAYGLDLWVDAHP